MRTRVSFLSASRSSSRMATALSTSSSRLAAEAMRVQLWQTPQKEASDWPLDQRARGWRSDSTARASHGARGSCPAPLRRARGGGEGTRPWTWEFGAENGKKKQKKKRKADPPHSAKDDNQKAKARRWLGGSRGREADFSTARLTNA